MLTKASAGYMIFEKQQSKAKKDAAYRGQFLLFTNLFSTGIIKHIKEGFYDEQRLLSA